MCVDLRRQLGFGVVGAIKSRVALKTRVRVEVDGVGLGEA